MSGAGEGGAQGPTVLDMRPLGHYADGSPRYRFHTSYPSRGVRVGTTPFETPELAQAEGEAVLRGWARADPMGNMGELCGVTQTDAGWHYVVNLYHSNT